MNKQGISFKTQRERKAFLALADGGIFRGWSFGAPVDGPGELVFNTAMSGYQEIISDPSYAGQFVVMTAPEIGNYGCNRHDMESGRLFLNGLVTHNLNQPSNQRSETALDRMLIESGVPGIAGIDTRRLTLHLRDRGAQKAWLHVDGETMDEAEAVRRAVQWPGLDRQDYAAKVTTREPYQWNETGKFSVVALDFGIKRNILRQLAGLDMRITVVPADTDADGVMKYDPDGIFLSNGPADPAALDYAIATVTDLLGQRPVMGICLGHQLLGLACGGACERLKFGHHGANHPVKNLLSGAIEITSQNHNYTLPRENLPDCLELTHLNLNDQTVEGFRHRTVPAFSLQYHPEAAPGPRDANYLFDGFKRLLEENRPRGNTGNKQ